MTINQLTEIDLEYLNPVGLFKAALNVARVSASELVGVVHSHYESPEQLRARMSDPRTFIETVRTNLATADVLAKGIAESLTNGLRDPRMFETEVRTVLRDLYDDTWHIESLAFSCDSDRQNWDHNIATLESLWRRVSVSSNPPDNPEMWSDKLRGLLDALESFGKSLTKLQDGVQTHSDDVEARLARLLDKDLRAVQVRSCEVWPRIQYELLCQGHCTDYDDRPLGGTLGLVAQYAHEIASCSIDAGLQEDLERCEWLSSDRHRQYQEALAELDWLRNSLATALTQQLACVRSSNDSTDEAVEQPRGGRTRWKDVRDRLERLRSQGERYTSLQKLADQLGCAGSTIHKAIQSSPELKLWATKEAMPRATPLNEVVLDTSRQNTESDPANLLPDEDVDAVMAKLINEAGPDERANLNALDKDDRRKLVETYLAQSLDTEPSPLEETQKERIKQYGRV